MSVMQNRLIKTLALASTLAVLGAVTGCHKKASGVNPSSLGPAPRRSRCRPHCQHHSRPARD